MKSTSVSSADPNAAKPAAPRLRILPHRLVRLDDSSVQIRTAASAARIRGASVEKFVRQLIAQLDGTRTEAEVLARYQASPRSQQVAAHFIATLRQNQILEELDPTGAPAADRDDALGRYLANLSQDRTGPAAHLLAARVGVFGSPRVAARVAEVIAQLIPATSPLPLEDAAGALDRLSHIVVVCPEPAVVHAPARELNDLAVEAGRTISFVAVIGDQVIQVGPTVYPTETACLTCIEQAFRRHNPLPGRLAELAPAAPAEELAPGPGFETAMQLAALDALHVVSKLRRAASAGMIATFRLDGLTCERVSFTRSPRCSSCGATRFSPPMRIWA